MLGPRVTFASSRCILRQCRLGDPYPGQFTQHGGKFPLGNPPSLVRLMRRRRHYRRTKPMDGRHMLISSQPRRGAALSSQRRDSGKRRLNTR